MEYRTRTDAGSRHRACSRAEDQKRMYRNHQDVKNPETMHRQLEQTHIKRLLLYRLLRLEGWKLHRVPLIHPPAGRRLGARIVDPGEHNRKDAPADEQR